MVLRYALVDPAFRRHIDDKAWEPLQASGNTVFGLWPDFTLAYCNPAWFRFSLSEGGEPEVSRQWGLGGAFLPPSIRI